MKVILLKDVQGTGKKDQIVEVSDGFGRNYLLPRKLAMEATQDTINAIERAKQAEKHRADVRRDEAEKLARALKGKTVIVSVRAGDGGRLYGSMTTQEVADALKQQHGIELDRRKIELDENVRSVGQTTVTLKLHAGISTKMIVNVVAKEGR
ncbi:MAG: 50S ribosomal protein L9 [Clostridia bacterium]|nr:50S ribosomal protein L9 [Clostridia bacterium]